MKTEIALKYLSKVILIVCFASSAVYAADVKESSLATKTTPAVTDKLRLIDIADGNKAKNTLIGSLPVSTATQAALNLKETKAVVQASAPADTTVDWYDTDQEVGVLILKRHNGTTWVRASSHGVQYASSCVSITAGMCVDTDDGKLYYHNNTAVVEVGTASGSYTLPTAAADTLGGVKVGARLTITDGVLSADVQSGTGAVDSVNGATGTIVLDADDISDTSTTKKFTTAAEKATWNAKQDTVATSPLTASMVTGVFTGTGDCLGSNGENVACGSFAFDTFPTYSDSPHTSGIAVNDTHVAIYSGATNGWGKVALTFDLGLTPTSIFDDFSGTLTNWTTRTGSFSATDGELTETGDYGSIDYTAQSVGSATQWIKVKFASTIELGIVGVILRSPGGEGDRYFIHWRGPSSRWDWTVSSPASFFVANVKQGLDTGSIGDPSGKVIGFTITGTGTSAVVRIFDSPVASSPSSATSWDAADDYDGDMLATGASVTVDSTDYVGVQYDSGLTAVKWDDFSGGSL